MSSYLDSHIKAYELFLFGLGCCEKLIVQRVYKNEHSIWTENESMQMLLQACT